MCYHEQGLESGGPSPRIGFNKFLVEFKSVPEKARVLLGCTWSFDKVIVCLFDCEGCLAPKDIAFTKEPFWLKLHDLHFPGMSKTTEESLGATMGSVLSVDIDASGMAWGSFLRVKVLLDISKPLAQGQFINMGEQRFGIPFKYERLPLFCFHYGVIKHSSPTYPNSALGGNLRGGATPQYCP